MTIHLHQMYSTAQLHLYLLLCALELTIYSAARKEKTLIKHENNSFTRLGQNAHDWEKVTSLIHDMEVDCPNIFATTESGFSYSEIMHSCEARFAEEREPLRICGLSLGAVFALDIQFDTAAM